MILLKIILLFWGLWALAVLADDRRWAAALGALGLVGATAIAGWL